MDLLGSTQFNRLRGGDIAYRQEQRCQNYVMSSRTDTRVQDFRVGRGEFCSTRSVPVRLAVLTTSCLMAEVASRPKAPPRPMCFTARAAGERLSPADERLAAFRKFVLDNYGDLLSSLIMLVDESRLRASIPGWPGGFSPRPTSRAWWRRTHQQLALDLGSVREVISRYLAEWERMGWVHAARGSIEVKNRTALASYGGGERA